MALPPSRRRFANAHAALDRAVLDAYGCPHDLANDDLLARLLTLNAARGITLR